MPINQGRQPRVPFNRSPGDVSRIAVFQALFLGDLLMAVPALRTLRSCFPDAEISLIGLPWASAILPHIEPYVDRLVEFVGYPNINEVPVEPERTARFIAEQRAYGYDLALQMHGDGTVSNGFVADLGASMSLGYGPVGDHRLSIALPFDPDENEVRRWLRLVAALGADVTDERLEFHTQPQNHERAAILLAALPLGGGPLVALHVGAKDAARRWPTAKFASVGDRLSEQYGARIVLTGSAGERPLTAAVQQAMHYPALDLAGTTDIGTFAALLAQLDLLVTNDTGASHLAAATGTRSVILFGPTRPARYAPLDRERHRVVDALCCAQPGSDLATALQQLAVDPVLDACAEQLTERQQEAPHLTSIVLGA